MSNGRYIGPRRREYSGSRRIEPGSQGTCIGLPRQYGPPTEPTPPPPKYDDVSKYEASTNYKCIHRNRHHRWRCQFWHGGVRHNVPLTHDSDHDAARAHNAYVLRHGLDRPLMEIKEDRP